MNASNKLSLSILAVIAAMTATAAVPVYRATHHYLVSSYCDQTSEDWNQYRRCLAVDEIGK